MQQGCMCEGQGLSGSSATRLPAPAAALGVGAVPHQLLVGLGAALQRRQARLLWVLAGTHLQRAAQAGTHETGCVANPCRQQDIPCHAAAAAAKQPKAQRQACRHMLAEARAMLRRGVHLGKHLCKDDDCGTLVRIRVRSRIHQVHCSRAAASETRARTPPPGATKHARQQGRALLSSEAAGKRQDPVKLPLLAAAPHV